MDDREKHDKVKRELILEYALVEYPSNPNLQRLIIHLTQGHTPTFIFPEIHVRYLLHVACVDLQAQKFLDVSGTLSAIERSHEMFLQPLQLWEIRKIEWNAYVLWFLEEADVSFLQTQSRVEGRLTTVNTAGWLANREFAFSLIPRGLQHFQDMEEFAHVKPVVAEFAQAEVDGVFEQNEVHNRTRQLLALDVLKLAKKFPLDPTRLRQHQESLQEIASSLPLSKFSLLNPPPHLAPLLD
eukprot:TRINITY_DN16940_c0_g5_i1.p1 TRINITY_DN16940_c0_g5~~TRINITY_DN16940_c0_g5_i1.p1  ORF type:complete len:240 (+),score=5.04 TRINITY_DN16940_c0_g5_i1:70-789(+)